MSNSEVQSKNRILKVEPITINVSPFGFHHYAKQFLEAARSIEHSSRFSPVPFYLCCHSIELSLKAYLLVKGVPKNELKKKILGHNLENILCRAETLGIKQVIQISTVERQELKKSNAYYADKGFEYFFVVPAVTGYPDLPDLEIIDRLADTLIVKLKAICLAAA